MKRHLHVFVSSVLAGICIGIGAIVYLALLNMGQKLAGSIFFGLGLFSVIHFGLHLYTGKIGLVLDNKPSFLLELVTCLIGNFVGVISLGLLVKTTRFVSEDIINLATDLVNAKQGDSPLSIFVLSCFCGIMIYLACRGHKDCPYSVGKALFVFMSVSIFILCGFEHCIANALYYTVAGIFDGQVLLYFFLMVLGNSVGAIVFDILLKLKQKFNQ